ncbi:carboxypeptidase-like regulatory domain-containing protein [Flammeovirga agarivorans]|uniref:Carboxypeptidase-like regulatory domain-containing protein n=1 Tax=Flammeovirga agarivorans TaxID=2726742 RepID=A0A7X8XW04_9BACT|nr:carboxypeptidase-like regulatory domain-containing protein [Flammeovirga agarivorans]NLR91786.1 carboxypeptidase-like regulatory domain-containing protein [Flammeovirga agarivorans]
MKIIYSIVILLSLSFTTFAQDIIRGVVVDAETKESLPYTNIILANAKKGTVSNADGKFNLSLKNIDTSDTLVFSYGGYETVKVVIDKLPRNCQIALKPNIVNLEEVEVTDKQENVKDIIAKIEDNFEKNYVVEAPYKEKLYIHNYGITEFDDDILDPMLVKKSSFEGLNQETFDELKRVLPKEFINYNDAQVMLYHKEDEAKLSNLQAISLEESTASEAYDQLTEKFEGFVNDMESSFNNDEIYYRFKMGIISTKIRGDSTDTEDASDDFERDSTSYTVGTKYIRGGINELKKNYASLDNKNWEFVTKRGKYNYTLEGASMMDDDVVYIITFKPKNGGLFFGKMYVSTETFAVLQIDFEYAPNKEGRDIHLFGFGYTETFKKGRVLFEKSGDKYYVKYINAEEHTTFSVERSFALVKKQKRFFVDKTLNEIKIKFNIVADSKETKELLVLDRKDITEQSYDMVEEEEKMKFQKIVTTQDYIWEHGTVIEPTQELKAYKRKEITENK